jgi:ABC-2 type transport system permease protein
MSRPSFASLVWERSILETKEFTRSRDQMIFIFGFPIIFMVLFGAILGGQDVGNGVSFTHYFLAGMIATGILNTGFQSLAIGIAIDRDDDVLKRLYGSPLPASAYFFGKIVHVLMVSVVQITILITIGFFAYGIPLPTGASTWVTFVWVFLLGTAASTLLGLGASSLPKSGRAASAVITPIVLVLQFISGVFFVFSQLPAWLQTVAEVFPLKWLAQGMRSVFLPEGSEVLEVRMSWEHGTTAIMLGVWLVAGLVLALKTFRWQRAGDR